MLEYWRRKLKVRRPVTLALGGGGIKGIAHIGVIRALEEAGITVRAVSGTSAGGLVGAVYAAGYSSFEIEEIISQVDQATLFSRRQEEGPSLMGLSRLHELIMNVIGPITFDDLKIPFACTAVDIRTAEEVVINHGKVVDAVLATMAVPGVFPVKRLTDHDLVDGGVLDPVPVAVARGLYPHLPNIAVCLSAPQEEWKNVSNFHLSLPIHIPGSMIEYFNRLRVGQALQIFMRSMDIHSRMIAELRLEIDQPEVLLRPDVEEFGLLDKADPRALIQRGFTETQKFLPQIRRAAAWYSSFRYMFRRSQLPNRIILKGFT
jgi:NTE family protein